MGLWTGPIGGYAEQSPAIADILIAKKINEINYQEGKQPDCTDKKAWIPISVPPIWTVWWCLLLNFSLLQFIHWHAMDEDAACLLWLLWGLNEVLYIYEELSTVPDNEKIQNKIYTLQRKHKISQSAAAWINLLPILQNSEHDHKLAEKNIILFYAMWLQTCH